MSQEHSGWYVSRDGQKFGPFSNEEFHKLRSSGELTPEDLLWRQNWPQWVPFATILAQSSTGKTSSNSFTKTATRPELSSSPRTRYRTIVTSLTLAVGLLGALGGGVLSNLQYFFPPRKIASVDHCDKSLGSTESTGKFSGIYAGLVWDGSGETEVQLKLVRYGNTAQGSYFRHGVCGKIYADIVDEKMNFIWHWGGASGRGVAAQDGTRLIALSGFGENNEGGGSLVFYQRGAE